MKTRRSAPSIPEQSACFTSVADEHIRKRKLADLKTVGCIFSRMSRLVRLDNGSLSGS